MGWRDSLRNFFSQETETTVAAEEPKKPGFLDMPLVVEIPKALYIKELAAYSAISLIANAISQCEILVYENGKQVKNGNWYSLNIKANTNESASRFWHKVIEKMLRADDGKGALVFVQGGNLYCADDYNVKEKRPFKATGNLYDGVVIDDLQLNKTFTARDTFIFKLENAQANLMIAGMYNDLSGVISAALSNYQAQNTKRWKFKIDAREAGTQAFQELWQNKLRQAVKSFVDGDTQVYIEYDGRTLDPITESNSGGANAEDNVKLINEVFELVSKAYHIPPGLMTTGNYNVSDLINQFLTFVVDPIADMIGKTLTAGYYDQADYVAGNYFRVDTSRIKHFDMFAMASDIYNLVSSGAVSINEARKGMDMDVIGDPEDPDNWANQHILTKNFETINGGQTSEENTNV